MENCHKTNDCARMFSAFVWLNVNKKHKPLDGKAVKVCMAIQQAMLYLQLATGDGLDL